MPKQEGYPSISIIRLRRSNSEEPGNNGSPKKSSATMQPKDHISIAVVYLNKVKVQTKTNNHDHRQGIRIKVSNHQR